LTLVATSTNPFKSLDGVFGSVLYGVVGMLSKFYQRLSVDISAVNRHT
jgi:hypothetical protein